MSLQYFDKNVFLLQYLFIAILCAKTLCVNKALKQDVFFGVTGAVAKIVSSLKIENQTSKAKTKLSLSDSLIL
jgi:hypothetical protein